MSLLWPDWAHTNQPTYIQARITEHTMEHAFSLPVGMIIHPHSRSGLIFVLGYQEATMCIYL